MKDVFALRSFYSAVAGSSTVLASFASSVIVANLLGVEGAGLVAFAVWIALVTAPVIDGGMASAASRFLPTLEGRGDRQTTRALSGWLARRLLTYNLISVAIGGLLVLLAPSALRDLSGASGLGMIDIELYALLVSALVVLQCLATFATGYFRGMQRFGTLATLTAASLVVQIICVSVGVHLLGPAGAIAGYALGQACLATAAAALVFRGGTVVQPLTGQVRRFSRYSWAANVCNAFVWSRIEILFLQAFWGFREIGLFSVALTLAALAAQGPLLLTGAFLPMLAEKHGRQDSAGLQQAFERGTIFLALIAFPICFTIAAVSPVLVTFLFGQEFAPAAPAAVIIIAAAAMSTATVIGTHLVNALGRSDFVFVSSLAGAVLSVALGFALIPDFGLLGAASSRAVVQILMIAFGLWFITRRLGFAYPLPSLLRIFLAAITAAAVAFGVVSMNEDLWGLGAAVGAAVVVYLLCLRLFGAVRLHDLAVAQRLVSSLPGPLAGAAERLLFLVVRGRPAFPVPSPSSNES